MFLLDTCVLAELRKVASGRADPHAVLWASSLEPATLFVSTLTLMELEAGARALEAANPTHAALLHRWLHGHVIPAFAARILSIDLDIALRAATLRSTHPAPYRDSLLAATALTRGLTLATRHTAAFESFHVALHNPWALSPTLPIPASLR
jgi:toxin FitB